MYTSERNNQIVVDLLKQHGIKKIIASPGAANISFVASVQNDPFFEVYSCVDERSAAYIACGIAAESGEPVVINCTGATASRNYLPGLTEAFYRKLPVIAITSTQPIDRIGHNIPQVIDRTDTLNDIVKYSVTIPIVKDDEDEWHCTLKANEALLEVHHGSIGPVHINLETTQRGTFDVKEIVPARMIQRFTVKSEFPTLEKKKTVVFIGEHPVFNQTEQKLIERFCEVNNAVVIGDHTSNYHGKYFVNASLLTGQRQRGEVTKNIDLAIHLGNISGAYIRIEPKEVWRVCEDGKLCDTFRTLTKVFEMECEEFFLHYSEGEKTNTEYYSEWDNSNNELIEKIPELSFSNIWVAKTLAPRLPKNACLHLGILNSLRSWNFFKVDESINVYSNTGGFGIDGCVSTIIGASIANRDKLFYLVLGDLAFFYDMNSIGNRHIGNNLRIIVVNNNGGQEFRNFGHRAAKFGSDTGKYIAAEGHYGAKKESIIKEYVQKLGFTYLEAYDKESFMKNLDMFASPDFTDTPIVFEVFTEESEENKALETMWTLEKTVEGNAKKLIKDVIGEPGIKAIKQILKR